MDITRRRIIKFALQLDIYDIHTYSGYKGGLILKITTRNAKTVDAIEEFAKPMPEIEEVAVKTNVLNQFEIYCVVKDDVYDLKLK